MSLTGVIVLILVFMGAVTFLCCAEVGAEWRYQSESWRPDEIGSEES